MPCCNERCLTATIQSILQRHRRYSHSHFIHEEKKLVWSPDRPCGVRNKCNPPPTLAGPALLVNETMVKLTLCLSWQRGEHSRCFAVWTRHFLSQWRLSKSPSPNKTPRIIFADFCGVIFGQHPGTGNHSCS